jgi:hypothetical protein
MGTKQMRVSEETYARIKSENREGETLAETLDRLVNDYSIADFAHDTAEIDEERPDPEEMERIFEEEDEAATEEIEDQVL